MNSTKWIIGFVVIIVIAIAAFMLLGNQTATAPTDTAPASDDQQATVSGQPNNAAPAVTTVTFTDTGFSPASVTLKAGESVTFINDTDKPMWVASAQHPTHTVYDGTNLSEHCASGHSGEQPFDQCSSAGKGGTYTFTFTKPGEWKYHNHMGSGQFGTIVVE